MYFRYSKAIFLWRLHDSDSPGRFSERLCFCRPTKKAADFPEADSDVRIKGCEHEAMLYLLRNKVFIPLREPPSTSYQSCWAPQQTAQHERSQSSAATSFSHSADRQHHTTCSHTRLITNKINSKDNRSIFKTKSFWSNLWKKAAPRERWTIPIMLNLSPPMSWHIVKPRVLMTQVMSFHLNKRVSRCKIALLSCHWQWGVYPLGQESDFTSCGTISVNWTDSRSLCKEEKSHFGFTVS